LTRTAGNLKRMWPRVYQLLDAVRVNETWRQAGDTSFEAYLERILQQPFAVFNQLELTHRFVAIIDPERFGPAPTAPTDRATRIASVVIDLVNAEFRGVVHLPTNGTLAATAAALVQRLLEEDTP